MDQPKKAICVDSLDEKMAKKFKKASRCGAVQVESS
jgi:hypothetical protein